MEGRGSCEQSKRSRIEKSSLTNIQDMELLRSQQKVRSLQVVEAKLKACHSKRVKYLERQLNEVRLRDQKYEEQMTRVREENAKLLSQIEELEHAPIPISPPE